MLCLTQKLMFFEKLTTPCNIPQLTLFFPKVVNYDPLFKNKKYGLCFLNSELMDHQLGHSKHQMKD